MAIIHCSGVCLVTEESSDKFAISKRKPLGRGQSFSKAYVFGRTVNLSYCESQILELLMMNARIVITRDQILDPLGDEGEVTDRSVDAKIKYLRNKLFPKNKIAKHLFIQKKYGRGYTILKR